MRAGAGRTKERAAGVLAAIALTGAVVLAPAGAALWPAASRAAEGAVQESAAADTVAAVWAPKELNFVYQGFTTKYSCDGLRDKVRSALLKLGAQQKGLQVREWGCVYTTGRPDPFPGVRIKMNVLQPLTGPADPKQRVVQAHWQPVDLKLDDYDALANSGQCELIEQIRSKILPLFTARDVDYQSNCIPHQVTASGARLKMSVLAINPKDQQGAAAIQSGEPVKP
jgi:hypothetical protein